MACTCIEDIDKKLEPDHSLNATLTFTGEPRRAMVGLIRRDAWRLETRRGKPATFLATFCPWCGVRYEPEASAAKPDTPDIEARQARSVAEVRELAEHVHGDQTYGDQPYVVHLDAVAAVLTDWGFGGFELQAGAYLHDVLEDTDVDHDHLSALVTPGVADIVWACTGEGETRDERMAAIYAKVARNGRAAVVKLADRVANLEASETGSHHALRYAGEHPAFSAALKPVVPRACWDRYVTAVSRVLGEADA